MKIYHVVAISKDRGIIDEMEIGKTENLDEARRIAGDEMYTIERDRRSTDSVEIRVYADEDEKLDYDTVTI